MKLSLLLSAVVAVATLSALAPAEASTRVHVRVHHTKQDPPICYKECPKGKYCARGSDKCQSSKDVGGKCFNPATSYWIDKCADGFVCKHSKCVERKGAEKVTPAPAPAPETAPASDAICYKKCDAGKYCARGSDKCLSSSDVGGKCFNPATSTWIDKCDSGFVCKNSKCDYARKHHKKAHHKKHD
ncbi:hypothetical protein P43SY_009975 [Pythium insidiosum]|uniref:Uncharacterized protein n=1 Tax=Pythium insidiosum TaxID=114742 RepID=A0AAD5LDM3_PYTIN|nr:hypothetical protein P43SY_009975 [Pythium insidiosum]